MTDALCGPSNPLRTFQKQTSVDRTLQQDRLAARDQETESFRSLPGPNAGILDAEYEAFQTGHPLSLPHPEANIFSHPYQQQQSTPPDWASDFQSLALSEPRSSPIPQSQFHQHAAFQRPSPAGWHEEFLRQQSRNPTYRESKIQNLPRNWAAGYTSGASPQYNTLLSPTAQGKQPEREIDIVYNEAAFEKAFDNAQSGINNQHDLEAQLDQDLYRTEEAGRDLNRRNVNGLNGLERMGSDGILNEDDEEEAEKNSQSDADELAKAAGQLLENVKTDRSQKFRESNFLSLMRQLRDREVRVEGDKIVDVSTRSTPVYSKHY